MAYNEEGYDEEGYTEAQRKILRFEAQLEFISGYAKGYGKFHPALVQVFDTAEFCKDWFEAHDIKASDMAIVQMAELVMRTRQYLEEKPESARYAKD